MSSRRRAADFFAALPMGPSFWRDSQQLDTDIHLALKRANTSPVAAVFKHSLLPISIWPLKRANTNANPMYKMRRQVPLPVVNHNTLWVINNRRITSSTVGAGLVVNYKPLKCHKALITNNIIHYSCLMSIVLTLRFDRALTDGSLAHGKMIWFAGDFGYSETGLGSI